MRTAAGAVRAEEGGRRWANWTHSGVPSKDLQDPSFADLCAPTAAAGRRDTWVSHMRWRQRWREEGGRCAGSPHREWAWYPRVGSRSGLSSSAPQLCTLSSLGVPCDATARRAGVLPRRPSSSGPLLSLCGLRWAADVSFCVTARARVSSPAGAAVSDASFGAMALQAPCQELQRSMSTTTAG